MWSGYRTDSEWQKTEQMLTSIGCELIECHASGHAYEKDIFGFIDTLNPARILPVHTTASLDFKKRFGLNRVDLNFATL
jgi:mRNA degradation ribonuclease J1/J2